MPIKNDYWFQTANSFSYVGSVSSVAIPTTKGAGNGVGMYQLIRTKYQ